MVTYAEYHTQINLMKSNNVNIDIPLTTLDGYNEDVSLIIQRNILYIIIAIIIGILLIAAIIMGSK